MGTVDVPAAGIPKGCPKYLKLAKRFEQQLRSGVLRIGDRLPSVRQLRANERVSAATAVGCYFWLERQGYIRARPKSGFYVSRTPVPDGPPLAIAPAVKGPVPVRLAMVSARSEAGERGREDIELGPAVVHPSLLPMNRLNRSIRAALAAFGDHAVRYEHPAGNLRLRRQIARLLFGRGVTCSAEDVIVTSGGTEALNLAIRAVAQPGDIVAVESPGCYEILQALEALSIRALEVPHVRRRGIDLDLLAEASRRNRIKAVITNATCHNPLGDCVSDESKARIVAFARAHDMAIIEGDTFGDLVFSGARPRLLKSFDSSGHVLLCSTLAHYVAPGFNIGWCAGGRWHAEVARLKAVTNVAGARLPQLALAEFLESGAFDKHVKQLRVKLWRSVEATRHEVLRTFPKGTSVSHPEGGFVIWIQLPRQYDGADVARRAASAGIHILPGAVFSPTGQYRNCIRIACGHPFEAIQPAVRTLARML
jgi:DNA-binding transcriptional MocR family regulator